MSRGRTRHVVIGGSGFTGSVVTSLLDDRGAEVVIFDRVSPNRSRAAAFIEGDVRKPEDLKRIDFRDSDVVYHLAARQFGRNVPSRGRDSWFAEVNVAGTENVLRSMCRAGTNRLVFFSTDMTYGVPSASPIPTSHPQRPLGPYGRSKVAAESLIAAARKDGVQGTIFRPRLITGPGRLGILRQLFGLIRLGLPVPLIGSGRNRYQMVGVEDCARAAIRAVELGCPPRAFNLGSAAPPSARALLEAIIAHAGSRSMLVSTPAQIAKLVLSGLDRTGLTVLHPEQYLIADVDMLLDTTDTIDVLGWRPERTDIDMMIAAYDHFVSGPSRELSQSAS